MPVRRTGARVSGHERHAGCRPRLTAAVPSAGGTRPRGRWERRLVALATVGTVLGVLHHADHATRGNHVGWPLTPQVTPFTPSLLVYAVLLGDIYLTRRGRVGARYWLAAGAAVLALATCLAALTLTAARAWWAGRRAPAA